MENRSSRWSRRRGRGGGLTEVLALVLDVTWTSRLLHPRLSPKVVVDVLLVVLVLVLLSLLQPLLDFGLKLGLMRFQLRLAPAMLYRRRPRKPQPQRLAQTTPCSPRLPAWEIPVSGGSGSVSSSQFLVLVLLDPSWVLSGRPLWMTRS